MKISETRYHKYSQFRQISSFESDFQLKFQQNSKQILLQSVFKGCDLPKYDKIVKQDIIKYSQFRQISSDFQLKFATKRT